MITLIKDILSQKPEGQEVSVCGWVRTKRETKNLIFMQVNDGSCLASIQLTFDRDKGIDAETEKSLSKITTGASVRAVGTLIASPGAGQALEVAAKTITVYGEASAETYPLQKSGIVLNFYVKSRISVPGQIPLVLLPVCGIRWRLPCIISFKSGAFSMYIRRSLLLPTAKEPVKCFRLLRSTCRKWCGRLCGIRWIRQPIPLTINKTFLIKQPI